MNTPAFKAQTESFFNRVQNENANRPGYEEFRKFLMKWEFNWWYSGFRDLPPNQGGKYSGFGYQMEAPPKSSSQEFFDTAVSSLASVSNLFHFIGCYTPK